jgi:hypothetical protein
MAIKTFVHRPNPAQPYLNKDFEFLHIVEKNNIYTGFYYTFSNGLYQIIAHDK